MTSPSTIKSLLSVTVLQVFILNKDTLGNNYAKYIYTDVCALSVVVFVSEPSSITRASPLTLQVSGKF